MHRVCKDRRRNLEGSRRRTPVVKMARAERHVEAKKRKKRPQGKVYSSSRQPLHVELLSSAGVLHSDEEEMLGETASANAGHLGGKKKQRNKGGAVFANSKCAGDVASAAAAKKGERGACYSTSEGNSDDEAALPGGASIAAGGEQKKRLQRKGKGKTAAGLVVPAALSKKILRLAEHQQRVADFSDVDEEEESEDAAVEDVLFGLEGEENGSRETSSFLREKVDAEGFVILDQNAADAAEEEEDEVYVHRRRQQRRAAQVRNGQQGAEAVSPLPSVSLADAILQKLKANETLQREPSPGFRPSDAGAREAPSVSSSTFPSSSAASSSSGLSPKVVEVYTAMAAFLKRYRSGKLPKAFKVLPRLQQWEEALMLTQPQSWSPHALAAATRLFCSNLTSNAAQRFLCVVLLPALRDDITEHKKLNYHLYQALKKALFKPAAFFKGIFLPLALEGCSRKEAVIVGSVVAKVSIPVLHGAAALLRLSLVPPSEWLPPVSLLMAVLINKKYSLPVKAVQACVLHFHRFCEHREKLPVSWHKAFLSFVQRYKYIPLAAPAIYDLQGVAHMPLVLTESDRSKLHEVLRMHFHELIGPEIRRELLARNPAAVLEQQALLLEKRQQQQQQQQQQQESSAEAARAVAMEVDA